MPSVGLMILAAGGSRRLGTPKQLLRGGDGESLLQHAAHTALASQCSPTVVVLGASAEAVQNELRGLALTTVLNPLWETGMASSLQAGLDVLTLSSPLDAVIVMLCDQPLVTPALLDSLVSAFEASGSDIVACEYGGIVGVPTLFSRNLFVTLRALQGDEGARRIVKNYPSQITSVPFPGGTLDVDTPDDLAALRQADNVTDELRRLPSA